MAKRIFEASGKPGKSIGNGIFEIKIIQSGWGSSGYYSPDLLKEYGPSTFRAGRLSFANHPTDSEFANGRDITKIMGKLITDAEFREDDALWAKLKVEPSWIPFVDEYKDSIGMSIFASGEFEEGEAEGRSGSIVTSFDPTDPYTSVDFVVAAGAGGKVERMLESFRSREALSRDREEQLRNLVRDKHTSEKGYAWVRDYDDANNVVYFEMENDSQSGIFAQTYSIANDVAVELSGEPEEVRVETRYVPLNSRQTPDSASAETTKENGMTPEEITALASAIAEALTPVPSVVDETEGPDMAEVAEAVATSGLPASARKRVYAAMAAGTEVGAAIEAEKALIAEVKESLKTNDEDEGDLGRVREAAGTGTSSRVNVPGWSN